LQENVDTVTIYGGVSYGPQVKGAKNCKHSSWNTWKYLILLKKNKLNVEELWKLLAFDEADRMLDMGFQDELESIIEFAPRWRQNLFSGHNSEGSKRCVKIPRSNRDGPYQRQVNTQETLMKIR